MAGRRGLFAAMGKACEIMFAAGKVAGEGPVLSRGYATHGIADTGAKTTGLTRFYKSVGVKEAAGQEGYEITLDERTLKTPARLPLIVPNKALALAIAAEWEWQVERIEPSTMPLMSLASTAIDQPQPRDVVIETMIEYVSTDPVVCRVEPGDLADKQTAAFTPILEWVEKNINATLEPSDSIFGAQVPLREKGHFRKYLQGMDSWELAAAEQLAAACKSVCIALAATRGHLSVEEVLRVARIEEDHQIEFWGLVEGGHDIDIADFRVRVSAPCVFVRLLKNYT